MDDKEVEFIAWMIGKTPTQDLSPENQARVQKHQAERARKNRKHNLMMVGYNQAMLDHAQFPITGAGEPLTRAEVERAIAQLQQELE